MDQLIGWGSAALGAISFFILSFRREFSRYRQRAQGLSDPRARLRTWVWFFLPYAFGVACILGLLYLATAKEPHLERHQVDSISTQDESISMAGRTEARLNSRAEHFRITLQGQFFGPELNRFRNSVGSRFQDLRVFAVVQETTPATKDLWFVQLHEGSAMTTDGGYQITAYLGGIGDKQARDGEQFFVWIYVPKDASSVISTGTGQFEEGDLPPAYYLSPAPISVITLRPK